MHSQCVCDHVTSNRFFDWEFEKNGSFLETYLRLRLMFNVDVSSDGKGYKDQRTNLGRETYTKLHTTIFITSQNVPLLLVLCTLWDNSDHC